MKARAFSLLVFVGVLSPVPVSAHDVVWLLETQDFLPEGCLERAQVSLAAQDGEDALSRDVERQS